MRILSADELEEAIDSPTSWGLLRNKDDIVLSKSDFSDLEFSGLDFSELDLEGCVFYGCKIKNCDFSRCNLYSANFANSEVTKCDFSGSLLTGGAFDEAEVSFTDFAACEMTGCTFRDTSFETCELSRARGLAQYFIDQAVGDTNSSIPQSLDYPEHWLQTKEEKEETQWLRKLSAFRGDDILFCQFDGERLNVNEFRDYEREEVKQALEHLQRKVFNALESKLLHNDCPSVYFALVEYYNCLTSNAGDGKPRWRRNLHELEQITVGLEGNNLISQTEALRQEVETAFPHKVAQLDHIISAHLLMVSGLDRWKSFVQAAGEANIKDGDVERIGESARPIIELLEGMPNEIDGKIPETIKILRKLISRPKETSRLGAYGIVRCVESIFSSLFVYVRKLIVEFGDQFLQQAPKPAIKIVVTGLLAAGAYSIFAQFPHLAIWVTGGISTLRGLGLVP